MMGATKEGELNRSCDLFESICQGTALSCENSDKRDWPYLALAFIYDSQYNRDDIKAMLDIWDSRRKMRRTAQKSNKSIDN